MSPVKRLRWEVGGYGVGDARLGEVANVGGLAVAFVAVARRRGRAAVHCWGGVVGE